MRMDRAVLQETAALSERVEQAVESLDAVPLLATALHGAGVEAPVTSALARLIAGELPLERLVEVVRTTVPPSPRWRPQVRPGLASRLRARFDRRRPAADS